MKTALLCICLSAALAIAPRADAAANLYVSPSGSDSNDCLTSTTACQTVNRALLRTGGIVQTDVIVNVDTGKTYSAPYASDGGAPSVMDGRATVDLEGLNFAADGTLTLLCSTQQINPTGLVVGAIDAGSLTTAGSTKYEGWVQLAIDGGFSTTGGYANDAGYCYMDGGACVLINNSLVGTFISFTAGAGGIIAPIVSNTKDTINFVTHGANGASPVAPTAAATYNIFAPASHIYPYPSDGGPTTSYDLSTIYVGGNVTRVSPVIATPNSINAIPTDPQVQFLYCDFPDAPTQAGSNTEVVSVVGNGLVQFTNDSIGSTTNAFSIDNYSGNVALNASYVTGEGVAAYSYVQQGGNGWLTGNLLTNNITFGVGAFGGRLNLSSDVLTPAAGATPITADYSSQLVLNGLFIDTGNSQNVAVQTKHGCNVSALGVSVVSDGGAGFLACGAGGYNSLRNVGLPDAGWKEISLDNGVTYSTQTARLAQDGGSAGVNALCDPGTGCCYTSY